MIDCANVRMRESLPEYMHGLLDMRERLLLQAHLAGCGACSAELAVLERCRSAMSAVPAMDIDRIVAALPAPPAPQARGRQAGTSVRPAARRELSAPAERQAGAQPVAAGHSGARRPGVDHTGVDHTGADHTGADHTGADHTGADHTGADHTGAIHAALDGAARRRPWGRHVAWRVAAAALLMVGSAAVIVGQRGHWAVADGIAGSRHARGAANGAGSDGQRAGDSAMLAAAVGRQDAQRDDTALSLAGGLSDLSEAALSALLGEVDAVEALPPLEPAPVTAFVIDDESGAL